MARPEPRQRSAKQAEAPKPPDQNGEQTGSAVQTPFDDPNKPATAPIDKALDVAAAEVQAANVTTSEPTAAAPIVPEQPAAEPPSEPAREPATDANGDQEHSSAAEKSVSQKLSEKAKTQPHESIPGKGNRFKKKEPHPPVHPGEPENKKRASG